MNKKTTESSLNFWDNRASGYDVHQYNEHYKKLIKKIVTDVGKVSHVLDVATGTGIIALEISANVDRIEANDFSPEMIRIAKDKMKESGISNINFTVQSAYNLDYPENTFDIGIICNSLHVVEYPEKALISIKRLLKPTAKIIVPNACLGETEESIQQSQQMIKNGFPAYHQFSVKGYLELIESCNYTISFNESIEYRMPMEYVIAKPN